MSESADEFYNDQAVPQSQATEPKKLKELLVDWLQTNTWEESKAFLKTNAELLLSDEALVTLDTLLAENTGEDGQDERKTHVLQMYRAILEQARSESIDAAYAEQQRLSSLASALLPISDELHNAIHALMATKSSDELLEQIELHPVLLTPEAAAAIDAFLVVMRQAGQEDRVQALEERYTTLKQVKRAKRPISDHLIQLLIEWFTADNWKQSEEILRVHADILLRDEGLEALHELQERFAHHADERFSKILQEHLIILRKARAESIDAAYAKLRPSTELSQAFDAFLGATSVSELLQQIEQHPILLTSEATTAIEGLLDTIRKTYPENAHFIEERYATLKQVIEAGPDSYDTSLHGVEL